MRPPCPVAWRRWTATAPPISACSCRSRTLPAPGLRRGIGTGDDLDLVVCDVAVFGDENRLLRDRLRSEQVVERVAVMLRQPREGQQLRRADVEQVEPVPLDR